MESAPVHVITGFEQLLQVRLTVHELCEATHIFFGAVPLCDIHGQ